MRVIVRFRAIALGLAITCHGLRVAAQRGRGCGQGRPRQGRYRPRGSVCRRVAKGCPGCPGSPRRRAESSGRQVV